MHRSDVGFIRLEMCTHGEEGLVFLDGLCLCVSELSGFGGGVCGGVG